MNALSLLGLCHRALHRVEGFPAGLAISRGSFCDADCRTVHYCLKASGFGICNTGAYYSAAATETFCLDIRLIFADPGFRQRAHRATAASPWRSGTTTNSPPVKSRPGSESKIATWMGNARSP